jgi:hypothetical protein
MNNITRFLSRFERRYLLIAVAVVLLLFNLGRWATNSYQARQTELESNLARLEQYGLVTGKTVPLEEQLNSLTKQKTKVEKYFFTGATDDKIASAMQIRIQALIARTGMQSESIRPIRQKLEADRGEGEERAILGEVVIKARLAGSLIQFMDLISELYRGKEFFKIESFSLKPYKSGLKIFIDLRGYYILPDQNDGAGGVES